MRKHIPNLLTLINLFCGCCAFVYTLQGNFEVVALLLLISGIADFFDGLTARWLGVASPIGKELDSLADVVSFGVVPAAFFYYVLNTAGISFIGGGQEGFMLALFAALRLAKFNIDTRQSEDFIGLNTPSCTLFVIGLMLMYHYDTYGLKPYIVNPLFLYPVMGILSLLMVSPIPMFGFKFKGLHWKGYEKQWIFVGVSVFYLLFLRELGLSLIIITYVVWNGIRWVKKT